MWKPFTWQYGNYENAPRYTVSEQSREHSRYALFCKERTKIRYIHLFTYNEVKKLWKTTRIYSKWERYRGRGEVKEKQG